ncbi:Bax inhibitor-1/YccA family protein [Zymobacter palmae]|uniref:Bax inhibitor-1/YccA family protein n=1 Tax=Zymobacter palmae TaxID=33074 RepID=UPI001E4188C7|nr:Bax inhibitor-1/YccA family protein [Zymobacter palmae]
MDRNPFPTVDQTQVVTASEGRRVLRNTYSLLAITLLFSAAMAWLSFALGTRYISPIIFIVGAYGLMFLVHATARTGFGLVAILAFTGFMGYSLGPVLNMFMYARGGSSIVLLALSMTGVSFLGLSLVGIFTRRDLGFLGNFITVGVFVLLAGMIINLFVHASALSMVMCCGFILLSSAVILFRTQQIVRGGETNYILATIDLYVSIYNIFVSLLQILNNRD